MSTRRTFLADAVGAGLAGAAALAPLGTAAASPAAASPAAPVGRVPEGRSHYELRTYELRNDLDVGRARAFFAQHLVPALKRAGAGPVGVFTPDTGLPTPSFVLLIPYASMDAAGAAGERLAADAEYRRAADAFDRPGAAGSPPYGPPYVRYDVALYRAFAGHPRLELPQPARPSRVYELRTYEAPSDAGLRAKVAMFNDDEIRIFRACGFAPVFFGEAVAGTRLPHLTYAIAFDSMEARAAAWARFAANPDWQRIRVKPGNTDPEAVSVIRSAFLRAADFSDVR